MAANLSPEGLAVYRIRASRSSTAEDNVQWTVVCGRTPLNGKVPSWPILGILTAGSDGNALGEVSVIGFLTGEPPEDERWEIALRESSVSNLLYDFARSHLAPLILSLGAEQVLPLAAPDPKVEFFEPGATALRRDSAAPEL